jgi:hypothetical protein
MEFTMQETNQETKNTSLFTELTAEESASVNGGRYLRSDCYRASSRDWDRSRRQVVYRRNYNGSFTAVIYFR